MMCVLNWKKQFQPWILARGEAYFQEGCVQDLVRTEDGYEALVHGSEDYEVNIILDGDSIQDMFCDCPYAEDGNNCKHMAAVLFAVMATDEVPSNTKCEEDDIPPADLVASIPEMELRPLITELAVQNRQFYLQLLLRYGNPKIGLYMKTLKQAYAAIGERYADRSGYIDYQDTYHYAKDTADFLSGQVALLLENGKPLAAVEVGMDVLKGYYSYNIDDSNGDSYMVEEAMGELCTKALHTAEEDEVIQVFDFLENCAHSTQSNWEVREFAKEALFQDFSGTRIQQKQLKFLDETIAQIQAKGYERRYSSSYELETTLKRRFKLMQSLSFTEDELDAFLTRYNVQPSVRKLQVERLLKLGKTDDAIQLLQEGKRVNQDDERIVAQYSEQLIDLYEQKGCRKAMLEELEYSIFTLRTDSLEMLHRLKKVCSPEQWVKYRERFLSLRSSIAFDLMQEEGLWERLFAGVVKSGSLYILDRYERVLKTRYPSELCQIYQNYLLKEAENVSNRKEYQSLMTYLKKLKSYPDGTNLTAKIAADWRVRYQRRRAMMDELGKAGF